LAAPLAGGHQTTVAEAAPPIARTSAGAPTVDEPAPAVAAAGHDASLPDGVKCPVPEPWLAAAAPVRPLAAGAAVAAAAGSSAMARATGTAVLRPASQGFRLAACLREDFVIMMIT
jgi:hypothetical protein